MSQKSRSEKIGIQITLIALYNWTYHLQERNLQNERTDLQNNLSTHAAILYR